MSAMKWPITAVVLLCVFLLMGGSVEVNKAQMRIDETHTIQIEGVRIGSRNNG